MSRDFDIQMRLTKNVEENDTKYISLSLSLLLFFFFLFFFFNFLLKLFISSASQHNGRFLASYGESF